MKKLLASCCLVVASCFLIINLWGCGGSTDTSATTTDPAATTTTTSSGPATTVDHSSISWSKSTLVSADAAGAYSSMAIDSNDKIHIAYRHNYGSGSEQLRYITNVSGSWVESLVFGVDTSVYNSIAVDSGDNLHIAFYQTESASYDLKYAYKETGSSTSWDIETIDSTGTVGQYNAVATDSDNNVYISYIDVTNSDLKLASKVNGSWTTEIVDGGAMARDTSIAVGTDGTIHLAYTDNNSSLKYAYKISDASTWTKELVDSQGSMDYASLALDSSNTPHIAYKYNAGGDGDDGALMYSSRIGSGAWTASPTVIDDHLSAGSYCSLAIDGADRPFIAYHIYAINASYLDSYLKVALYLDGAWTKSTVDTGDNSDDEQSGKYNSLVIDSSGRLHVSYYDEDGANLKYAVEE
ncbi:MAG: hypothetical protein ABH823_04090 [bacterium]